MKLKDILKICKCKKQIYDSEGNKISENAEYYNVCDYLEHEVSNIDFEDYFGIKITIEKKVKTVHDFLVKAETGQVQVFRGEK